MGIRSSTLGATDMQPPVEELDKFGSRPYERPHPQESFVETVIDPDSFYGKLRHIYSEQVLKTQLEQLRKQGSYDAFKLKWNPKYEISRLHGAMCTINGSPPTLYWDSDVGKWIEAACYFLASPDGKNSTHALEFDNAIEELVEMMSTAQQSDGYLGTYFTVVDRKGRLRNLRDMHEMYNCGHLLEASLAHYRYTGSRKFLSIMIRYVELLSTMFGPGRNQLHGYPGHPELELAVLRLYSESRDPRHYAFGKYLVAARGVREPDLGNRTYFVWEAQERRKDTFYHRTMDSIDDGRYHLTHAPLHEQPTILGHSVRAMYLLTAAADLDGPFLSDAKRLWTDTVDRKMYPTGGVGSVPSIEGFSEIPHFLPNGADEGGCYAETCASIACMMVSERLLSHDVTGKVREVLERCLVNTVLGGASLDGKQFYYDNQLATYGEAVAERSDWFDVCCCPPNLTRTMGLLGGYTWSASADSPSKIIKLDVYVYLSASRRISLPAGQFASVKMSSEMPWEGRTVLKLDAPTGWRWQVRLPKPEYATNYTVSCRSDDHSTPGFASVTLNAMSEVTVSFDMPVRLLSPHPATHQDTLTVSRGPIIYTAETYDNEALDNLHPHFAGIGLTENAEFEELTMDIGGIPMVALLTRDKVCALPKHNGSNAVGSLQAVDGKGIKARRWFQTDYRLKLIPFFARSNRGAPGRIRTSFNRAVSSDVEYK